MKKTTTALATAGLIGLSTLGLSAPAVAATDIGDLTFYTVSDFALR